MSTATDLLDAIRTHLATFELPAELASVTVTAYRPTPQISVQLAHPDAPEIATALLAWADTLTGVTAHAWRVPDGHQVHLSVTGRLPDGLAVQVYGGLPYTPHSPGSDLDPATTTPVLLTALRHLADIGEVPA
ncbi:MAG: hypothetical protein ACRDSP_09835 [Pseudonocardiaceae bacterium]